MPSILCPGKPSWMNVLFISQNSIHGLLGATALILSCGTLWVICHHNQEFSRVIHALGPLFFSLVLQKITMAIDADDDCVAMLFNTWFLDDGLLAGKKSAILRALSLIDTPGPPLDLHINLPKCEPSAKMTSPCSH